MKCELNLDKRKKVLSIPTMAVKSAGLRKEKELRLETGVGFVLITKGKMTAKDVISLADGIARFVAECYMKLEQASGLCDDNWSELPPECEECLDRETGCDSGVAIPPCVLREAGIDPNGGVEFGTEEGKITVTAIEREPDPLDDVPPHVLYILNSAGVCLDGLRKVLESGEIICE